MSFQLFFFISGKPTLCRKRKGIRGFLRRVWKAMRHRFGCCCHCSAVDDVEPFAPPADLDPEPDPDHSAVKPNNGESTVIIS